MLVIEQAAPRAAAAERKQRGLAAPLPAMHGGGGAAAATSAPDAFALAPTAGRNHVDVDMLLMAMPMKPTNC